MSDIVKILRNYPDDRERGKIFEKLVLHALKKSPLYKDDYKNVWLWDNWPQRSNFSNKRDLGIDIVCQNWDNTFTAVQCKAYKNGHTVSKGDIDKFVAYSADTIYTKRILVYTGGTSINENARAVLNSDKATQWTKITENELNNCGINWQASQEVNLPKELKEYQIDALKNVLNGFKNDRRGQLIMPCGSGKTLVSIRVAEALLRPCEGKVVLVLAPSISLISQILRDWRLDTKIKLSSVAVCSDSAVQNKANDIDVADFNDISIGKVVYKNKKEEGSDRAKELVKYIDQIDNHKLKLIVCTYDSLDVIEKAQKKYDLSKIYLTICDEAHKTSNLWSSSKNSYADIHDENKISSHYRLYMTATPKEYRFKKENKEEIIKAVSLNDDDRYKKSFGKIFHTMSFRQAIDKGILSDYRVIIMSVPYSDMAETVNNTASLDIDLGIACRLQGIIRAINKYSSNGEDFYEDSKPIKSVLMFSNLIKDSQKHHSALKEISEDDSNTHLPVREIKTAGIYSKTDSVDTRNVKLDSLREDKIDKNTCQVIANVRCLSEGIDVPSLDAVAFVQPRKSKVDIVQAVGRIMRLSPNKKYGYVILPIAYDRERLKNQQNPEDFLNVIDKTGYDAIYEVVNALRSHDDSLDYIETIRQKIIVADGSKRESNTDIDEDNNSVQDDNSLKQGLQLTLFDTFKEHIYTTILKPIINKNYWHNWANNVKDIVATTQERMSHLIENDDLAKESFNHFLDLMKFNIIQTIDKEEALKMLSQHFVTQPVFENLFAGSLALKENSISKGMEQILDIFNQRGLKEELYSLDESYKQIVSSIKGLPQSNRETLSKNIYDTFLNKIDANHKDKGIVYTPAEVIDFMNQTTDDLLKKHFNSSLADKNTQILDPFAGTGRFLVRLMANKKLMPYEELKYKYENNKFHVNEIVLLSYYIAGINIESVYQQRTQEFSNIPLKYKSFKSIALVDTFSLNKNKESESVKLLQDNIPFSENAKYLKQQENEDIQVVICNPPYGGNIKDTYWRKRINTTYGPDLNAYHTAAIRWASDRIFNQKQKGIISLIINGNWLDKDYGQGLRRQLEQEFAYIYIYDLLGNASISGDSRKDQGDNIFDTGSKSPIIMLFLVSTNSDTDEAKIYYKDIGKRLSTVEKLKKLSNQKSIINFFDESDEIDSNVENEWLNKTNPDWHSFQFLAPGNNVKKDCIMQFKSQTVTTTRDSYVINHSKKWLINKIEQQSDYFNKTMNYIQTLNKNDSLNYINKLKNSETFKWDEKLKAKLEKGEKIKADIHKILISEYFPFIPKHIYFDKSLINNMGNLSDFFNSRKKECVGFVMSSKNPDNNINILATKYIPETVFLGSSFGRSNYYPYEIKTPDTIFGKNKTYTVNISDESWEKYKQLDSNISKSSIFYYIYGILHSLNYLNKFKERLLYNKPKIPIPKTADFFWIHSQIGQQLFELHLNYEKMEEYNLKVNDLLQLDVCQEEDLYYTEKLILKDSSLTNFKSIRLNEKISIDKIPKKAFEYKLGLYSPVEWVVKKWIIEKKDGRNNGQFDAGNYKDNDPNNWIKENNLPNDYLISLIKKLTTLSLKTVDLMAELKKVKLEYQI